MLQHRLNTQPTRSRSEWDSRAPGDQTLAPVVEAPRPAAVLVPLYLDQGEWHLLLTQRTDTVSTHKGQVAFPGGRVDPDDRDAISTVVGATLAFPFINNMPVRIDEDSLTTALHDTHKLGTEVSKQVGSIAFERLHAV